MRLMIKRVQQTSAGGLQMLLKRCVGIDAYADRQDVGAVADHGGGALRRWPGRPPRCLEQNHPGRSGGESAPAWRRTSWRKRCNRSAQRRGKCHDRAHLDICRRWRSAAYDFTGLRKKSSGSSSGSSGEANCAFQYFSAVIGLLNCCAACSAPPHTIETNVRAAARRACLRFQPHTNRQDREPGCRPTSRHTQCDAR